MPEIIQDWLGTRLGIILDLSPQKFGRNTKDGTILAKLLYSYGVVPQHVFDKIQESRNYHDCYKNLMELKPWLDHIGVTNEDSTLQKMAGGEGSAAISIFYSVYLNLERKDRFYYLSAQKERRFTEDSWQKRFKVDWVPEIEVRQESEEELSRYARLLYEHRDLVKQHKEKCKQVVNILKKTKKKFEKAMKKNIRPAFVIPTRSAPQPMDRHTREVEETKEGISAFEKKHWEGCTDLTYSQLVELKNAEEGRPCFVAPNLAEAENIVNNIRGRKRRELYAKNFLQKMQHLTLDETWKEVTEKQDKEFENTVCEFLLKQSQYEKQMAGKLHLIRNQKKVLAENRRKIERLKLEQGEKEFDDLVEGTMEMKGDYREEEEFEQKRIAELHRRLYDKKVKTRSMLIANETRQICEALVDIAIRVSEARAVTACQLPKSFIKDLKELFYKGFPISDVLDNFEELYLKSTQLNEGENEEEQGTLYQDDELERMRNEESKRQSFLDECDFHDYLNLLGPWMAQLFFPEGSETEPKHTVLGHVVHELLAAKYPVPNLPVPVPIKAMKPTAVVLGLSDDSACKMLEDLMEIRGVLVVKVDDAINFVLATYKEELSATSDIDLNFRKVTAITLKDKTGCEQEKENKKIRLLKKEKPEKETPVEDEPPQMDKETQTPRKIPEELPLLSPNAETGKLAFEALGLGDPVPDPVIVSAIVAYVISKQDNYDGWVLLNYPVLYSQASELECALRGFRILPIIDDMESLEEVEGFTYREPCANPFAKDQNAKNHLSRLVPQFLDNTQPPDELCTTYFDTFAVMKKIANPQEDHVPKGDKSLMEKYYTDQDVLLNLEYQNLNFQLIKNLGKLILKRAIKSESDEIIPKTSVEIFGEAILELNEKWETKKSAKPKDTATKRVTRDSANFRQLHISDFSEEVGAEESFQREAKGSGDKKLPESQKSAEKQGTPPKPGDPGWEWATGQLPKQIQVILASLWESMETVYVEDFQDVFFYLRVHRSKVLSYSAFIRQSTKALIRRPDEKQKVLSNFHHMFNDIDEDLRPDVDVKCELHVRVSELEQALMSIADERKANFLKDLKKIAKDSWVADEMAILVNAYLTAVQLEVDRCVDTCQVIMDYYVFLQQKVPDGDPLGRVTVPKLQTGDGRYAAKSFNRLSSPRQSESKRSSKLNLDKGSRTRSWTERRRRTTETGLLTGAAEAITNILVDLTLPEDGLTPFHTYFLDTGDSVASEARNIVEFCLSEARKGEKPPQKNAKKPSEVKPPANTNLSAEWVSALETELDRFVFRLKLILAKGLFEMNEFLTMILNVISSLSEDITEMYLKEIQSISECCKVFRCGIEEEIGIQPQLELRAEEFIVNQDVLLFSTTQEPTATSLEDEQKKYRFTIEQLNLLFLKLQHVAPEGEIVKRSLAYIFEDLRTLNPEIETGNCFPEVWNMIEPDDIIFIMNEVYQELEIVHWKDFIVCAMDLPFPTETEVLSMRKSFRSYDPFATELITRENYDSVKFWFETTLDHFTKVDRCEKAKDLLYRMYQVDEHRTNYSALLFAFCKDENPIFGFTKALALVMGKRISLREHFGDYMSMEGEGAQNHFEVLEQYDSDEVKKLEDSSIFTAEASRKSSAKRFGGDHDLKSSTTEMEEEMSFSENVGEDMSLFRYDLGFSRRSLTAFCIPYDMLTALFKTAYPSLPQLSILLDCKQTFEETLNSLYDSLESHDEGVDVIKLIQHKFVSRLLQSTNKFKSVREGEGHCLRLMAGKMPEFSYTCEICGMEGFNEESMRTHTMSFHLDGAASCPFCDFSEVSPDELLVHVNTAHLDYLTPEDELFDFIDDDKFGGTSQLLPPDPPPPKNINISHNNNNYYYMNNINNNNECAAATTSGAGAEGSPLRTQLNLNLKRNNAPPPQKKQQCMMCGLTTDSPFDLEEHINRRHFDLTSPTGPFSLPATPAEEYRCPLCVRCFANIRDLELHVNMEHRDVLSPAKTSTPGSLDNWSEGCPVCCRSSFRNNQEMVSHIEEHFNNDTPATPDLSSDRMLAKEIDKREKETMKQREQREFELLQAQYGMDNQGNFKEQSLTNMQKAVYAGEMSVSDFYERQIELKFAENNGIDDGSSCTRDLVPRIRAASQMSPNVARIFTCTTVDHYASTYGDKGWGCGYRNLQMLISSLLYHTGYNDQLYKPSLVGGSLYSASNGILSRSATPSISKLQQHIEWAWRQGFDVQGCDQLGGKLHNTRKWIGATEVVTVLSSLRIRCQLVDFDRPTSPDGSHPELFNWVMHYFQKYEDFKPPLYLQHQGHSRTIVGIEQYKDGHLTLLVFDPSHTPEQMNQLRTTTTAQAGMRLIRRTLSAMKARQYQLVAVRGIMDTETEYQQSKLLRSTRIPQDP